jgi:MFS family permease
VPYKSARKKDLRPRLTGLSLVTERELVPGGPLEARHLLSQNYRNVAQTARITRTHYHVALANFLGYVVDSIDANILGTIAPSLILTFGISLTAYAAGTQIAMLVSIVGTFLWPWLADRFGRRLMLTINIAMFSLLMPLLAVSPNWTWFVAVYAVAQIAISGEWYVASILMVETWPARLRGLLVSWVRSSYVVGISATGVIVTFVAAKYGWRWAYVVPAAFAVIAIYVRFLCPETPYWVRTRDRKTRIEQALANGEPVNDTDLVWNRKADKVSISQLFLPDIRRNTIAAMFVATMSSLLYNVVLSWLSLLLVQDKGWTLAEVGVFLIPYGLSGVIGYIAAGWLIERYGRRVGLIIVMAWGGIFMSLFALSTDRTALWVFGLLYIWGINGMFGPVGVYIPELFPTRVRGVGSAFSYGFARIVGLGFPFVVVLIKTTTGTYTLAFLCIPMMLVIMILGFWLFCPETAGRDLDEISV